MTILIALIGALASIGASLILTRHANIEARLRDAERLAKLEERLDTVYRLLFRKGVFEGLSRGLLASESPIRVNVESFKKHAEFVERLHDFYEKEGKNLSDVNLLMAIEKHFSADLAKFEVEHGLVNGASLAAACYLVRPEMTLFDQQVFEDTVHKLTGDRPVYIRRDPDRQKDYIGPERRKKTS